MVPITTETLHSLATGLDTRPHLDIASILVDGQIAAAVSVKDALSYIEQPAQVLAQTIINEGVIHYTGAGSSGLMAAADAMELGGTFSIPPNQLRIHMAGGLPTSAMMPGNTEDDVAVLITRLADMTGDDTMIAVSASGATPYTLAAAKMAKSKGTKLVAIANNANSALLAIADYPILLSTPPEVLAGSTKLGAATAQKIALNMLSTLMAVNLGHIHDGMMVNVIADNAKLRLRALSIVCQIADVKQEIASKALEASRGAVKPAILMAAFAISHNKAEMLLKNTKGHLRPAIEQLKRHIPAG